MKELSIEQKAERYDEALEKARDILNSTDDNYVCTYLTKEDIKGMYSRFFPELIEEFEDERIRKEIIEFFENCNIKHLDWIAWLEKQDEQKIDDDDKAILENWEGIVKDNKEKWQLSDWFVEATLLLVQKIKRIGLSKPIVDNNKTMLNACINVLRNRGHSHLAAWLEKQDEQKPAEWSEEDELMLLSVIQSLELTNGAAQIKIDWLKSLKGRVQPKQEWSEEDNYNLQCMIAKVTSDIQKGNVGRNNELIDWLKSLKQRIGG